MFELESWKLPFEYYAFASFSIPLFCLFSLAATD